ncbi:hypothetical protein CLV84_3894 [Neolewinella xylanilytica]|uniref:Uncharacterized protein n=1 Tax=Neolewinella xylanilytica TaxID=1514080 RepID=A0A2S6I1H5_9BACT|nr:hypothetical protein [Neolewinella xylanilytica]PPK84731.1 hypothetical protein CLV84_3894 [Neolewinella xylanilytica]
MRSISTALKILFVALLFGAISCKRLPARVSVDTGDFYTFGQASKANANIIQDTSVYEKQAFREMRQKFGMLPEGLREKIAEMQSGIEKEFPAASIEKALGVGLPVWERSRAQADHEKGELLLVPLVTKNSKLLTGLLVFRLRDEHLDTWHLMERAGLLHPLLEDRPVESRSEYVNLLLTAAFDHYLFDYQFLPDRYTINPNRGEYEPLFSSTNNDPATLSTGIHFMQGCFEQYRHDVEGNRSSTSKFICEPYYLVDYNPTVLLDQGPTRSPAADPEQGGG